MIYNNDTYAFAACGAVINLATYKEHAVECKIKLAKVSFGTTDKKNGAKFLISNKLIGGFFFFFFSFCLVFPVSKCKVNEWKKELGPQVN